MKIILSLRTCAQIIELLKTYCHSYQKEEFISYPKIMTIYKLKYQKKILKLKKMLSETSPMQYKVSMLEAKSMTVPK